MWLRKCGRIFRSYRILCPEGNYRTEPGVSTPGRDKKGTRPEGGGREAFSVLDVERDPQRISAAPSAPPTRYAGAIPTWRSTPSICQTNPTFRARGRARVRF